MFEKVLVANRGEIALRVVRACQELGVPAVAVYSEADETALHVRHADESVNIGPPAAGKSYLNVERIIEAAEETGADAIHPGYGFLAENAAFARAVTDAGMKFIGPSAEAIEKLGDKSAARRLAQEADVPVVPGSENVSSADEAVTTAEEIGYPVMIKAAAGGGGRGIRVAENEEELRESVQAAKREAQSAFGDGTLYLEKFLAGPRHVEVQVMADHEGNAIHLYERECSMQRRRQKVLEESPSPGINQEVRERMCEAAVRLAREADYANAGTVEFLVEGDEFYFIEMNTRIQVEHPVTEMLTGVDLVKEQIRVASGEPLSLKQEDVPFVGHSIEFRLNAEDPDNGFMPSPGEVTFLDVPGGPGVRVDSAMYQGYRIPPFYDSMVGKLVVWALTREEAISRARRALREYRLEGIKTTIPLHLRLLDDDAFRSGDYHTGYLEELLEG
ncbi:MAG: Biotin carboxylase of acetyl-CoA carboxylase [uncultured Rubrobacteraceae bacterium]|uniref:Biotin carboxylase n=1 Tax=uncultured Rubrobacteraceae bacterium TaxID=349277 RepID=A0A6J4TAK7_9ACTN|nr:MAG: Biotin carboxylase of acetyl-CoA carboxylase [uncultured Rubrobacteraceae bacterium]